MESYPPKLTFSEDHILSPKGCCAPKFLHALENNQVLLAHPTLQMVVSLTNFFLMGSKIGLTFCQLATITLKPKGVA